MIVGLNSMPTDTKNQHGEGVAQRQRFRGSALAELGFAQDHAGKERPRAKDTPNRRAAP